MRFLSRAVLCDDNGSKLDLNAAESSVMSASEFKCNNSNTVCRVINGHVSPSYRVKEETRESPATQDYQASVGPKDLG